MQTNFFSTLSSLNLDGNFRLNIQRQPDNKMLVSVLLVHNNVKDKSVKQIPALVLAGFIDDLDKEFFDSIQQPMQKQNTLLCNLSAHEKALEKTKKDNENKSVSTPNASGKQKRFDEQMKKVADLEKQQKYGQAIAQLPKEKDYPEYTTEISKKMQELKSKHGSLSLFDTSEELVPDNDTDEEENPDEEIDEENMDEEEEEQDDNN